LKNQQSKQTVKDKLLTQQRSRKTKETIKKFFFFGFDFSENKHV